MARTSAEASRCLLRGAVIGPRLPHRGSANAEERKTAANRDIVVLAVREVFCFVRLQKAAAVIGGLAASERPVIVSLTREYEVMRWHGQKMFRFQD